MLERNAAAAHGRRSGASRRASWIYAFPQQFDSLRQGLVDLVANLFDKSVYQDAPIMRGVYFTSGTQEGRPVDRVMANMAEAFGVRPRVAAAAADQAEELLRARRLPAGGLPRPRRRRAQRRRCCRSERVIRWVHRRRRAGRLGGAAGAADLLVPREPAVRHRVRATSSRSWPRARAGARPARPAVAAALESAEPMAARLAQVRGPAGPTCRCASAFTRAIA